MNVFLGIVAVVCAFAMWSVVGLPWRARIFPQTIAGIGLIVTALSVVATRRFGKPDEKKEALATDAPTGTRRYLAWAAGYLAGIALVGLPVASALWVAAFLKREDNMPWHFAVAAGAAVIVTLLALGRIARFPGGWLIG